LEGDDSTEMTVGTHILLKVRFIWLSAGYLAKALPVSRRVVLTLTGDLALTDRASLRVK
jgi:hypothetical protein